LCHDAEIFSLIPLLPRYTDMKVYATERYGYSLIECLLVISCAAILAAVAAPNLHRLQQEWTLWGGVRSVESSLQWGRMHAVSSNTSIIFNVSADGCRYFWSDAESGEKYENSARSMPGNIRIESVPGRSLRFYQHGNAAPAGTYVIRGETGTYSVIVSPGGRIRIERH
jgi:Tfp pilus assembly protein FimT